MNPSAAHPPAKRPPQSISLLPQPQAKQAATQQNSPIPFRARSFAALVKLDPASYEQDDERLPSVSSF